MGVVLVMMMCGLSYQGAVNIRNDELRETIQNGRIPGNPIYNFGKGIVENIVRPLAALSRSSLYDFSTQKVSMHPAPSKIENFDFSKPAVLNSIFEYGVGVANYGAVGVALLLLSIFSILLMLGVICFGCIKNCCNVKDKDLRLKEKDFSMWLHSHKHRRKVQNISRLIIGLFTIANLCMVL